MVRVFVTGGYGFIGSYLVRRLLELGFEVVVFDNFSRSSCVAVEGASVVKGDLRFAPAVERALDGVDVVYHLAALTDVRESVRRPRLYHRVNADGTLNLLEGCRRAGVRRVVYVSSCAVYGEPVRLPIGEDHPTNPLSPYAASKLAAEAYCRSYAFCYGFDVTVFRLFNVYGPRQSDDYAGVISTFVKRVCEGKPPIIYGSGEQSRDFIYVGDVVECLAKAIDLSGFDVFNLGSGRAVTVNELAELVLRLSGRSDLKPVHVEGRRGEIFASVADVSKVERVLGFRARKPLEEGIKELIEAYSGSGV
jgi:UDP-glucose 4-epimerase